MNNRSEILAQMSSPLDYVIDRRASDAFSSLERAIERKDTVMAFQPVVQADASQRPAFYEGMIRVMDETGRFIPLHDILPAAQNTHLGRQIDCAALDLGLQALAKTPALRLSVNMSTRTIGDPDWLRILHRGIQQDTRIAERLIIEISESAAMSMPDTVIRFMDRLQDYGISFALDDFGAGYTSFRYLRDFNFDMIKIDGQFIRGIARHPDNQVLIRALLSIAHHFDMLTIAESVEDADDAAFLIDLGVDCLQGYYFGAPTIQPPWEKHDPAMRQG